MAEYVDPDVMENDDSRVIDIILNMFDDKISRDLISAVVENCGGNLQDSVNGVLTILSDDSMQPQPKTVTSPNMNQVLPNVFAPQAPEPPPQTSYASVFKTKSAKAKRKIEMNPSKIQAKPKLPISAGCDEELKKIESYHDLGYRTLIIMRGLPGSGKTFLAKHIVDITVGFNTDNHKIHIFSADDFFVKKGYYDPSFIGEAHQWNRDRVRKAIEQGLSPIIVDNTNTELWEMESYVRDGVKEGYYIIVLESKTPWSKNVHQLAKKNIHGVALHKLCRMDERYQSITKGTIIQQFGLSYPNDKIPPVLRDMPLFTGPKSTGSSIAHDIVNVIESNSHTEENMNILASDPNDLQNSLQHQNDPQLVQYSNCISSISIADESTQMSNSEVLNAFSKIQCSSENENDMLKDEKKLALIAKAEEEIKEITKVEEQWEMGEDWVEVDKTDNVPETELKAGGSPKPQRNRKDLPVPVTSYNLMPMIQQTQNWQDIKSFLPGWDHESVYTKEENNAIPINTVSCGTSIEHGDMDVENNAKSKIVGTSSRDINLYYVPENENKIPNKTMVSTSSMVEPEFILDAYNCQNKEKQFIGLHKIFQDISKSDLKEIFDSCCGNVDWTVDILLQNDNGILSQKLPSNNKDKTSNNEENCNSNITNNIVSNIENVGNAVILQTITEAHSSTLSSSSQLKSNDKPNIETLIDIESEQINEKPPNLSLQIEENCTPNTEAQEDSLIQFIEEAHSSSSSPSTQLKKNRRDKIFQSESNLLLIKQLQENIVIADDHYSEHCLKIRKLRRSEWNNIEGETSQQAHCSTQPNLPPNQYDSSIVETESSTSEDDCNENDKKEVTINVNVGREFIIQLDSIFNRSTVYSENVVPMVNMPMSLLHQIDALWMESYTHQLQTQAAYSEILVNEDREFARKLAQKESELALAGKEPEVPDFKEIMEMDLALSLYQKDVSGWKNNTPNNLAAKLTREKLYDLFPDLSQETLLELLMAHDNNFQATVEVLLVSTGQEHILEQPNGLNKFVMSREIERRERLLEEEKQKALDEQWPVLTNITGEIDMNTAERYRNEAMQHLQRRNLHHQKAQDCMTRGMTQIAGYYSEMAGFHTRQFEQANSLAATSFIQYHAAKGTTSTLDLHYLFVGEAMQALDLFLDHHIQHLRNVKDHPGRNTAVYLITGRGLHSKGGPRIKPATKRRLRERGLTWSEMNPGLLTVVLTANNYMTHQVFR